ncbi:MAG: hypothetical protein AB7O28_26770 [Vicinamibacterales bacterium]
MATRALTTSAPTLVIVVFTLEPFLPLDLFAGLQSPRAMPTGRSRSGAQSISRIVVYTHRWLGIILGVLFTGWFVSGVVLMYAGMPRLSPAERLAALTPIDSTAIRVAPREAAAGEPVDSLQVAMFAGRPVYRMRTAGATHAVFADTGEQLAPVSREQALLEAGTLARSQSVSVRYDGYVEEPDQWTLEIRRQLPMHRVAIEDGTDTRVYVSASTGELLLKTTDRTRLWAYPGAILHWIYMPPIRRHVSAWSQFIIWSSIAGTVMTLAGLAWGLWRFSPRKSYRLRRAASYSPYAGWMWWHHYAGLAFGVVTLTWIFSGLLSMDPWDWHPGTSPTAEQRAGFAGPAPDVASIETGQLLAALLRAPGAREAHVVKSQGGLWLATDAGVVPLDPRGGLLPLDARAIRSLAHDAMPGTSIEHIDVLEEYDSYYYDRQRELPLPVVRVQYDDPIRTTLYVDPRRGTVSRKEERLTRLNRWLYHGLHSLDFPFLYYRRPLWDLVVIVLSIGGLALTLSTLAPAWRRLRRHAARLRRPSRVSGGNGHRVDA